MKQFNKKRTTQHRILDADWPPSPDKISEIFEPRHSYRKLIVLIDAHLIAERYNACTELSKSLLLFSLLNNELIKCYRYADSGPPPKLKPLEFKDHAWLSEKKVYKGWAVAHPFEENGAFWPVTFTLADTSFTNAAVSGNIVQWAERDESSRAYETLTKESRAERRRSDMLAHEVAEQALQADMLVTDREYLLEGGRLQDGRGLTVCSVDEAIPLLSLYLRAQREYIIPMADPKIRYSFNRGLFYWVGTRELLPEAWRWFSACVYHSSGSGDDKLQGLGGSVLSRVQRAIEARDRVHIALNRITNNDINDDALGNLDHVLMLLMGAVDASARVAHCVLGLTTKEKYAGWQSDGWLRQVAVKESKLADLFAENSRHKHALEILRLLRNSVHGEALQGVTLQAGGVTNTVMRLPRRDEAAILTAMDALGGRDRWGYQPFAPGHDNIQPGVLVDRLLEEAVGLLNSVMKETPVELLSNIEKANLANKPPEVESDGRPSSFSEWNRLSIRWQLGM